MQDYFFANASVGLTNSLRSKMFGIILTQDIGWFDLDENNTGVILKLLQSDVAAIQNVRKQVYISDNFIFFRNETGDENLNTSEKSVFSGAVR